MTDNVFSAWGNNQHEVQNFRMYESNIKVFEVLGSNDFSRHYIYLMGELVLVEATTQYKKILNYFIILYPHVFRALWEVSTLRQN